MARSSRSAVYAHEQIPHQHAADVSSRQRRANARCGPSVSVLTIGAAIISSSSSVARRSSATDVQTPIDGGQACSYCRHRSTSVVRFRVNIAAFHQADAARFCRAVKNEATETLKTGTMPITERRCSNARATPQPNPSNKVGRVHSRKSTSVIRKMAARVYRLSLSPRRSFFSTSRCHVGYCAHVQPADHANYVRHTAEML